MATFDRLLQTIKQDVLSLVNTWFLDTYGLQWIQDSAIQFVIHLLLSSSKAYWFCSCMGAMVQDHLWYKRMYTNLYIL